MSRSGYIFDDDDGALNLYRANVERALHGKRGQAFLKELLAALEALPEKKLIEGVLECDGQYCALGAVGRARGINMSGLDPDAALMAYTFNIADAMAREIVFENDEGNPWDVETPEQRYKRVRAWVYSNID